MSGGLKEASYPGWHNTPPVRFAYLILGKSIYFSALTRGTSTINAAEDVIRVICKEEGIFWDDGWIFYDIQTSRGYYSYDEIPKYYVVSRLTVRTNFGRPFVEAWHQIASYDSDKGSLELPQAVLNRFLDLAYPEPQTK